MLNSDEKKNFQEKLLKKAEIISESANKIWGQCGPSSIVQKIQLIITLERQMQFELEEE
jgi:hypothetical protein